MNHWIDVCNQFAESWWTWTVHAGWQSTVVALLALAAVAWGRRWPSVVRYGILLVAFVKFAVPPIAAAPGGLFSLVSLDAPSVTDSIEPAAGVPSPADIRRPPIDIPDTRRSVTTPVSPELRRLIADRAPAEPQTDIGGPSETVVAAPLPTESTRATPPTEFQTSPPQAAGALPSWKTLLMLLHAAGAIAILVWTTIQVGLLRRIRKNQTRVTNGPLWEKLLQGAGSLGLRRRPALYLSRDETAPYSYGVLRPVVVLPQSLVKGLSEEELQAVLAHELAHHRRGDFWLLWFQVSLLAFWWFHPLMWMLARSMRRVREDCCDDTVLQSNITTRQAYCETLLAVAAKACGRPTPAAALSALQGHSLENRFRRIMDQTLNHRDRLAWGHRLVLLVLAVLLLPGLNQAQNQPARPTDTPVTEPPSAEELLTTVTGTIKSQSGAPVSGADVLVLIDEQIRGAGTHPTLLQRGISKADGTFAVPIPKSSLFNAAIHPSDDFFVWVSHPREGWSVRRGEGMLPEAPLPLTLNHPEPLVLTIRDPQGQPASGMNVSVEKVKLDGVYSSIPEQLKDRFVGVTDERGRVPLPGTSSENLVRINVTSKLTGSQMFYWEAEDSYDITLTDAVPVRGKLVGNLPAGRSFDEISLRLSTKSIVPDSRIVRQWGIADLRVSKDGTFATSALAEGKLHVVVDYPDDFPAFAHLPTGLLVSGSANTEVILPLNPAVRVTRRLIDSTTKQPVPDVRIHFQGNGRSVWARTDLVGRFSAYLAPDPGYSISYSPPRPYLSPGVGWDETFSVPRDTSEHRLPPLELTRGVSLGGRVVDENGEPVQDIRVTATWRNHEGSSSRKQSQAKSDEQGRFQIPEVHPTAELELRTYQESVAVGAPVTLTAETNDKPLQFIVPAVDHVSLAGRVTDRREKPVADADYKVFGSFDAGPNTGYISELHSGKTDADGRFKTPARFHPQGSYQVVVVVGDREVGGSKWSKRGANGTHRFDVVINDAAQTAPPHQQELSRVALSAIVSNRDGDPVPDAKVVVWTLGQRLRLGTDGAGRFGLSEVYKKGAWIFVDADGYRFFGEFLQPAGLEHRITLVRADEPAGEPLRTISDKVSQVVLERAQLELIKFTESILETNQEHEKWETLSLLPQLAPSAGLDYIDDPRYDVGRIPGNLTQEWHRNRVRFYASQQFVKNDIPRAIATANQMTPGTFRVYALCELAGQVPEADRAHRNELWVAATRTARDIEHPSQRLEALTSAGASLLKHGETNRGSILLREAARLAQTSYQDQLNKRDRERDAYVRARLAWELSPIDLETALTLIPESESEFTMCRFYGNLAHQIADVNPAEAERVFEKLPEYRARDDWAVRVCYRMAKVDYERARQLADSIASVHLRPYAWGVMAQAVAGTDPDQAQELLAEAYDALEELVDSGQSGGREIHTPVTVAVSLLPVAEQVDPDRLREYFWKALSFRRTSSDGLRSNSLNDLGNDPVLGAFLSRYDRDIAGVLVRVDAESLSPNADEWPYFLFGGLAAVDPAAAVELVSGLPEQTEDDRKLKVDAWEQVVPVLINRGADRWNWLQHRQYNLWRIDELDL